MRSQFYLLFILSWTMIAGCGTSIGDSCTTNVECSPLGDRTCDTAQLDGYCTILGCDANSCPDEAVCIRFFPSSFLSQSCDPATEDALDLGSTATNDCLSSEVCLSSGFCVLRNAEQRYCMKSCESDDDCRSGYECRNTGTQGAEAVLDPNQPGIVQEMFCAQKP